MNTRNHSARSRALPGLLLLSFLVFAALSGCGDDVKVEAAASDSPAADAHPQAGGEHAGHDHGTPAGGATVAGITFDPPEAWQDLGPSGMRAAQYRLPAVEGDPADAEVNVFYFGANSGGGVEANLQRWIGQMILPDGADAATAIQRGEFTADGMQGHTVTVNGSYKSGGGRPMGGDGQILEGYRLVGVVLEGPQGSVFFKLTGPLATAEAMEGDLLEMVHGARK